MIEIKEKWKEQLLTIRKDSRKKLIYVLGKVDTGKTTLCKYLIEQLKNNPNNSYIDCDPGQSFIGPPGTTGLKNFKENKEEEILFFTGSTSPVGHLLQTICGVKRLSETAKLSGGKNIVVDSSGFVLGDIAREFQYQLINLLSPDYIIALQEKDELKNLLNGFKNSDIIRVIKIKPSKHVKKRDLEKRKKYREGKFKDYFMNSKMRKVSYKNIGLQGRKPNLNRPEEYMNRLIAINDRKNFVITLGILRSIDENSKTISFYSPPWGGQIISNIVFGSICISLDGEEL